MEDGGTCDFGGDLLTSAVVPLTAATALNVGAPMVWLTAVAEDLFLLLVDYATVGSGIRGAAGWVGEEVVGEAGDEVGPHPGLVPATLLRVESVAQGKGVGNGKEAACPVALLVLDVHPLDCEGRGGSVEKPGQLLDELLAVGLGTLAVDAVVHLDVGGVVTVKVALSPPGSLLGWTLSLHHLLPRSA